jgi:hypothetical protein
MRDCRHPTELLGNGSLGLRVVGLLFRLLPSKETLQSQHRQPYSLQHRLLLPQVRRVGSDQFGLSIQVKDKSHRIPSNIHLIVVIMSLGGFLNNIAAL